MRILVCLKQVPDSGSRLAPSSDGTWIDEESLSFVVNDFDLFALEAALKRKDADASTEVVVASIGPERCKAAVRTALAIGADRAVVLVDDAYQGGDAWSNSAALAAVARAEGPFDVIHLGLQSSDGGYGQTGPFLAERLALPCATGVMSCAFTPGAVDVERELDGDRREKVHLPLPCVLTFQTGAGDAPPRYASIKGIMAAKKKELKTPSPGDLQLEPGQVGRSGRRLVVRSLREPPRGKGAEMITGAPIEVAQELVRRIRERTGVI
jgi:electron transfer flavoprotein beta subunit